MPTRTRTRTTRARRLALTTLAVPASVVLAAGPALAADGVTVVSNETVQAHLDATGRVLDARVYQQLDLTGTGTVTVTDPVSTDHLRNLDSFGGLDARSGTVVSTVAVSGDKRLRTVSNHTKALPLTVGVTYLLNGREVAPAKVVGATGDLEVRFDVRNTTRRTTPVSYDDGTGTTVTKDVEVVVPMVASLTTTLPSTFTDVSSGQASVAGDGHGATSLRFTLTLFGPIGSPSAQVGYRARITDGVVPPATLAGLPVSPLDNPSFKGGAASYQAGAASGVQLTGGARTIDANLLKLRDGAGQLLAGLIQLRDGATQLNTGLAGTAVPGAAALADGANQAATGAGALRAGLVRLDDGAAQLRVGTGTLARGTGALAVGATKLAVGAKSASTGAQRLADGSTQVADGLDAVNAKAPALVGGLTQVRTGLTNLDAGLVQLYGGIGGLPAKAQPLHDGIGQLVTGIGSTTTADSLLYGVDQVRSGLAAAAAAGGSLDQLKGGTDQVKAGLDAATAPGGSVDRLAGGVKAAQATVGCSTDPVCSGTLAQVYPGINTNLRQSTTAASAGLGQVSGGLGQLKTSLGTASSGLARVECGLSSAALPGACDPARPGLLQGLGAVDAGVTQLVNGVVSQVQGAVGQGDDTAADQTLRGGTHSLGDGVDQISAGGQTLIAGLTRLGAGAGQVADGSGSLATGLGTLSTGATALATGAGAADDGAGRLAAGAGQLADGTSTASTGAAALAEGNQQIASGAGRLSSGLQTAADGSGRLAGGLVTAAGSAPALRDGAQQLSTKGSTALVAAGKKTSADYGEKYAVIVAGAQRAKTEAMAYGLPAGATGATAYSLELAGMDGGASRNLGRGLGALVVFALGTGLAAAVRRRLV